MYKKFFLVVPSLVLPVLCKTSVPSEVVQTFYKGLAELN